MFALALSGGGILGAAHLGAIEALFSAGLVPEAYAGTSAGGLVAGYLAADGRLSALIEYGRAVADHPARYFSPALRGLLDELVPGAGPLPTGILDADRFVEGIVRLLPGVARLQDLKRSAALVSFDLSREEAVVFAPAAPAREPAGRWRLMSDAPLKDALLATMAMPGLFSGWRRQDAVLVDGGVADTLPADWAYALAPGPVLAVNVASGRALPPGEMGVVDALTRSEQYMANIISTLRSRRLPVLTVAPDTSRFSFLAFKDFRTLVDIGRRTIQARLPEIRRFVGQSP